MPKNKKNQKLYTGQPLHKQKLIRMSVLAFLLIAGAATGVLLIRSGNQVSAAAQYPCTASPQHPTLYVGVKNQTNCVRHLQQALNLVLSPSPGLSVDGAFGTKTQSAVYEFQRRIPIKTDGKVGPQTWDSLFLAGCYNEPLKKFGQGYTLNYGGQQRFYTIYSKGFSYQNKYLSHGECKRLYF